MQKLQKKLLLARLCGMHDLAAALEIKIDELRTDLIEKGEYDTSLDQELSVKDLTQDDLLLVAADNDDRTFGHTFLDTDGFWEKLPTLAKVLRDNGQPLDTAFFKKIVYGTRTVLETAKNKSALSCVFNPQIWEKRELEMMRVYFELDYTTRGQNDLNSFRRALATHENRPLRDDLIVAMLPKPAYDKLYAPMRDGDKGLKAYLEALLKSNLKLNKIDFLVPDSTGDFCFYQSADFNNFKDIAKLLIQTHNPFTVEDLTLHYSTRPSILKRASQVSRLDAIFDPDLWVGRLGEMMRLYDFLEASDKANINLVRLAAKVQHETVKFTLPLDNSLTKDALFAPMSGGNADKMIQMATAGAWQNFDKIQAILTEKGTPITLADLRVKAGIGEESLMIKATQSGCFDKILQIAAQSEKDSITIDDLLSKSAATTSLIDELESGKKIPALFQAAVWRDRVRDMLVAWRSLRTPMDTDTQKYFDMQYAIVCREALRLKTEKGKKGPRRSAMPS